MLNVGQGSSTLLIGPEGETILIDSGDWRDDADHTDAVLEVTLTNDGEVTGLAHEAAETVDLKEQAQSRFDRLAERPPNDDKET